MSILFTSRSAIRLQSSVKVPVCMNNRREIKYSLFSVASEKYAQIKDEFSQLVFV